MKALIEDWICQKIELFVRQCSENEHTLRIRRRKLHDHGLILHLICMSERVGGVFLINCHLQK